MPAPRVASKSQSINSVAQVRLGKNFATVVLEAPPGNKNNGKEFEVPVDSVPEYLKTGRFRLRMSASGKVIYAAWPLKGHLPVVYAGMPHQENQPPKPFQNTRQPWQTFDPFPLGFSVNLEVAANGPWGEFKGFIIPVIFDYRFVAVPETNMVGLTGKGKATNLLDTFLTYAGCDLGENPIEYQEHLLPEIDAILSESRNPFGVVLEKGYAQSFTPWQGLRISRPAASKTASKTSTKKTTASSRKTTATRTRA